MNLWWLLLVGPLLQGITEVFPISSSAHIALVAKLFPDPGVSHKLFDVVLNTGTMLALLFFFRREVCALFCGGIECLRGRWKSEEGRFFLSLCIATLPAVIIGFLFHLVGRSVDNDIAITSIAFAILLLLADHFGAKRPMPEGFPSFGKSLIFGIFQSFAFLSGASRLGTCLTAGRMLGYGRVDVTRFAFLMAIPQGLGALVLHIKDFRAFCGIVPGGWISLVWVLVFSGGLLSIVLPAFLKWLKTHSFMPFILYRIILGILVLFFL